jgi:predicted neuraminidase
MLGPEKNKPIQLADGSILAPSALNHPEGGRRIFVERSTDGGKSWTKIGPLHGKEYSAAQPTILTHADGRIQMLMRQRRSEDDTKILEIWSSDSGLTWTPLAETSLPNNHSGLDAVTLKDGRFLLAYNHSTRQQPGMGHKGRGVLNVSVSKDGKNWEAALVLEYHAQQGRQFSYPSVIQTQDGMVHIVYTWHRRRIKHVVIDPDKLVTFPIIDGKWPADKIPILPSPTNSDIEEIDFGDE